MRGWVAEPGAAGQRPEGGQGGGWGAHASPSLLGCGLPAPGTADTAGAGTRARPVSVPGRRAGRPTGGGGGCMNEGLLASARTGDTAAFTELTEPYRRELQGDSYPVGGSGAAGQGPGQEKLLSGWRGLGPVHARSSRRGP